MTRKLTSRLIVVLMFLAPAWVNAEDWVSHYYLEPTPDRFVEEITALSKQGELGDEKKADIVSVFISQIFRSNPEQIQDWMEQLKDLPLADQHALRLALWLADTDNARSYLTENGEQALAAKPPPDVLTYKPGAPEIIDMWWAYFYATGEEQPVRNVITAFQHADKVGSLDAYNAGNESAETKRNVVLEMTFLAARWSLENNLRAHAKVVDISEASFEQEDLSRLERLWLGAVLAKNFPGKYQMQTTGGRQTFERVD